MMRTIHATLMKPLLGLLLVLLLLVPYSKPLSLVGSSSNLTLAIDVVVRVITVSVRTSRETTCVVRWSALTIVRHVAPAADASLTSRFITFSAWSVAIFVAFFLARRLSLSLLSRLLRSLRSCDGGAWTGHRRCCSSLSLLSRLLRSLWSS